jgi:hypothetical protein
MAISTLTELKAAITSRLGRSDLSDDQLSEFVALGEAWLNRKLRLLSQSTTTTPTLSSGSDSVSLPDGFAELISLQFGDNFLLTQIPLVTLEEALLSYSGRPERFAVADTFKFIQSADQDYTLRCTYYKKFDIITDTTNWLLTNVPDLYLAASMVEAAEYIRNDQMLVRWERKRMTALEDANRLDAQSKRRAKMQTDPSLSRTRRFNINTGF